MINLIPLSTVQFHSEYTEGLQSPQVFKDLIEVRGRHGRILFSVLG